MPVFQAKTRTIETYLAGIGASGALIASAFVMFVLLVGAVTFDAWPRATSLIRGGEDGQVQINAAPAASPVTPPAKPLNLLKLLTGKPGPVVGAQPVARRHGFSGSPGVQGTLGTGNSGGSGGQSPVVSPEPGPIPQPKDLVTNTVSAAGNTTQAVTDYAGGTLGGDSNPVGGLVTSLGQTVNSTLQGLVGNG